MILFAQHQKFLFLFELIPHLSMLAFVRLQNQIRQNDRYHHYLEHFLTTTGGAKGVGQSTTAAVVTALLAIFVTNFLLTLVMFQGSGSSVL